jgi:hypothetical protein
MRILSKFFLTLTIIGFLTSCGGGKSACDCAKELQTIMEKAMKDPTNAEKIQKEAEALKKDCEKYTLKDFENCK